MVFGLDALDDGVERFTAVEQSGEDFVFDPGYVSELGASAVFDDNRVGIVLVFRFPKQLQPFFRDEIPAQLAHIFDVRRPRDKRFQQKNRV